LRLRGVVVQEADLSTAAAKSAAFGRDDRVERIEITHD
jgi:hypothetical protein